MPDECVVSLAEISLHLIIQFGNSISTIYPLQQIPEKHQERENKPIFGSLTVLVMDSIRGLAALISDCRCGSSDVCVSEIASRSELLRWFPLIRCGKLPYLLRR